MHHLYLVLVGFGLWALGTPVAVGDPLDAGSADTQLPHLGLRGMSFVENQGQWSDERVIYGLRSRGLDVAFRESSFTMHLQRRSGQCVARCADDDPDALEPESELEALTLELSFPGSNPVLPQGASAQTARFNYFVGGEGRSTVCDVPSFAEVVYANLYDGVDLRVMDSKDGVLKYEFHCAPGADYSQICIAYDGIDDLCVDGSGDLHTKTTLGTLIDAAPIAWQESGSSRVAIPARFETGEDHTCRVALDAPINPALELIIDPDLVWMSYVGGTARDEGSAVTLDATGDILITGQTISLDFEGRINALHGLNDAFVARVSATGEVQWMTYLGGSSYDSGNDIALDAAGSILIAGNTSSTNFEGRTNAAFGSSDGFVAKLTAQGTLLWMTYVGGSRADYANGIAVDGDGNALAGGETMSNDWANPTNSYHGGYTDGFVVKLSPAGVERWSTYVGGRGGDPGYGMAVDVLGFASLAGQTDSTDFDRAWNTAPGPGNGFVAQLNTTGAVQWATYLGGASLDGATDVEVTNWRTIMVGGWTGASDFPGRLNENHGGRDAFLAEVSSSGFTRWMVYLGGTGSDEVARLDVDEAGTVALTGYTESVDFEGAENTHNGGSGDGFVAVVSSDRSLAGMLYLGGSSGYDYGNGIAMDRYGNIVVAGSTQSADFNEHGNEHRGGQYDAVLVKLTTPQALPLAVQSACPWPGPIQITWSGATRGGEIVLLFARSTGAFAIPSGRPCPGTVLGLGVNQIQVVFQGSAGPEGSRTLNSSIGPRACGGHLQLLDLPTCATSAVARIE